VFLVVCSTRFSRTISPQRLAEGGALAVLLVAMSVLVFIGGRWEYPYLIFPLLVWAALRFGQVGATVGILVVAGIATWGTVSGSVPTRGASATEAVQILQALIAVVAVGVFVIAATIDEREQAMGERAAALDELSERNEMHEMLLNALGDFGEGFIIGDGVRLVHVNAAFCDMIGYSQDELSKLPSIFDLLAPEDRSEIAERLKNRLAGDRVQEHYETTLIRKDGQRIRCQIAAKLVHTRDGPRVISLVHDISERAQVEAFRQNFLAYAAHELRGPITVIAGYAEVLEHARAQYSDQVAEIVEALRANAETMRARLDTVLEVTRLEHGDVPLQPESVDVRKEVSTVLRDLAPPEGKNVELRIAAGTTAYVDRSALHQIVGNLITNAYRYGGDRVAVAGGSRDGETHVEVSDDGTGVPPDLVQQVFEPFVRDRSARRSEGSGLGLSIVRALARASRGDVEYVPGEDGARFRVRLPGSQPS
jgi:PAS domain S-box-containing protein